MNDDILNPDQRFTPEYAAMAAEAIDMLSEGQARWCLSHVADHDEAFFHHVLEEIPHNNMMSHNEVKWCLGHVAGGAPDLFGHLLACLVD